LALNSLMILALNAFMSDGICGGGRRGVF